MKDFVIGLALCAVTATASAQELTSKEAATAAAIADSVSTYVAVAAGGVELNPLVSANVGGLIFLAGVKLGALELLENSDQTAQEKTDQRRAATAMWSSFSISNLMIALTAATPLAIIAGIAGGSYLWTDTPAENDYPAELLALAASE